MDHLTPRLTPYPGQSPPSESTLPQERLAQQREVISADQQDLRRETGRYREEQTRKNRGPGSTGRGKVSFGNVLRAGSALSLSL